MPDVAEQKSAALVEPGHKPAKLPEAARFDAFISYSRAVDARLTRVLQSGLQRFAKPWYRLRLLRVFRDDASLSANPGLWSSIEQALDASSYLILLASFPAAGSKWVDREVAHWLATKDANRILLALTEGEIAWDQSAGDFDWKRTTALPRALAGAFVEEPRWIDLRWARTEDHLALSDPRFREAVADLAAPIHGRPKDELIGEEVRQHRRTLRVARGAALVLAMLTAAAIVFGVLALHARNDARAKAQVALSRQLAAQSDAFLQSGRLDLGLLLAAQSYHSARTGEARNALVTALLDAPHVRTMLWGPAITGARFTPTGRWLAVRHASRDVDIWNVETQQRVATVRTRAVPTSAAVSPDGGRIAIGFGDGTVELRDLRGNARSVVLTSPSTPPAVIPTPTSSTVREVVFSPDGRLLAWTDGYRLGVRNGDTTRMIPLTGAFRNDWSPAFSHDGRLLAAIGGTPPQITTWQVGDNGPVAASARTFFTVSGADPRFGNLGYALDPANARLLALGHFDGTVSLWDLVDRRQVARLRRGHGPVVRLAFSSDGKLVAGVDNDGIRVWRLSDGQQLGLDLPSFGSDVALGFLPSGHALASVGGEGAVTIEDLDGLANQLAQVLPGASAADDAVAVSTNGSIVAAYTSAYRTGATVDVWDRRSRRLLGRGTFDPGGFTLDVTARDDATLAVWASTRLTLWDARTNRTERQVDVPGSAIDDVVFGADGDALVALLRPGRPLLWSVGRGAATATLPNSASRVRLSPDERRAVASDGERTWLLDTQSGKRIGEAVAGSDPVFSSDGRVLAVPTLEGTVHVVDARNGRAIGAVAVGPRFQIDAVSPSGDGMLLAVVGGTFGGGPLGTLRTNELELWDVHRNVLFGSKSLATGLPATGSPDVRFLSESGHLVTTGFGGVAVWNVDPDSWASRACALVHRTLTRAEWSSLVGSGIPYDPACLRH